MCLKREKLSTTTILRVEIPHLGGLSTRIRAFILRGSQGPRSAPRAPWQRAYLDRVSAPLVASAWIT